MDHVKCPHCNHEFNLENIEHVDTTEHKMTCVFDSIDHTAFGITFHTCSCGWVSPRYLGYTADHTDATIVLDQEYLKHVGQEYNHKVELGRSILVRDCHHGCKPIIYVNEIESGDLFPNKYRFHIRCQHYRVSSQDFKHVGYDAIQHVLSKWNSISMIGLGYY